MGILWELRMILVRGTLFLGLLAFVSACGDSKTLTAQFSAAQAPQLLVVVSMNKAGSVTQEDIRLTVEDATKTFGGNPNALKACAKYLGWIEASADSGNLSGLISCSGSDATASLAGYFASFLAAGLTPPSDSYSAGGVKVVDNSSGYVFIISFYDLDKTVGNRCFQLTAAEIRDSQFFNLSTGQSSGVLNFDVQNVAYPSLGDNPATDRSKCFKF